MKHAHIIMMVVGMVLLGGSLFIFALQNPEFVSVNQVFQMVSSQKTLSQNSISKTDPDVFSRIQIGNTFFDVEIANTPAEREKGLSGRSYLAPQSGVWFIFQRSAPYSFWMPDMNFSIDIVWVNSEHKIVYIERNVTPESYPTAFTPPQPTLYVLEVNAGEIGDSVKIGDSVVFYPHSKK